MEIEGVSEEREMKAIARKKKYDKELDGDAQLEKSGGNTNANGDKYKDATINFWGATVSKKEARQFIKAKKSDAECLEIGPLIALKRHAGRDLHTLLHKFFAVLDIGVVGVTHNNTSGLKTGRCKTFKSMGL